MKITDKFSHFETKKEISGNVFFLSYKVKLNFSWKNLAAMFIRIVMKSCRNNNLGQFPEMFQLSRPEWILYIRFPTKDWNQPNALFKLKKYIRRIFQSVFYGKADFNVSIEVSAEKLAENLKKTLSEKKLFIYLCLQPNLEHECQINLSYHPSQYGLVISVSNSLFTDPLFSPPSSAREKK